MHILKYISMEKQYKKIEDSSLESKMIIKKRKQKICKSNLNIITFILLFINGEKQKHKPR
jgi:hypothetical protein